MQFRKLIEYNTRNIFLQISCRKWGRETSSRPFLFFKIALYEVKASGLQLSFNIFQWPSAWYTTKKLFRLLIQIYSLFLVFRKGSGNSFSTIFCVWFFKKKCFSCYILLTQQIALSDFLYFLWYWAICVLEWFLSQVVTLWILKLTLFFYSHHFSTWRKSQDKNLNILRMKRAF